MDFDINKYYDVCRKSAISSLNTIYHTYKEAEATDGFDIHHNADDRSFAQLFIQAQTLLLSLCKEQMDEDKVASTAKEFAEAFYETFGGFPEELHVYND